MRGNGKYDALKAVQGVRTITNLGKNIVSGNLVGLVKDLWNDVQALFGDDEAAALAHRNAIATQLAQSMKAEYDEEVLRREEDRLRRFLQTCDEDLLPPEGYFPYFAGRVWTSPYMKDENGTYLSQVDLCRKLKSAPLQGSGTADDVFAVGKQLVQGNPTGALMAGLNAGLNYAEASVREAQEAEDEQYLKNQADTISRRYNQDMDAEEFSRTCAPELLDVVPPHVLMSFFPEIYPYVGPGDNYKDKAAVMNLCKALKAKRKALRKPPM